ncbi:MAG: hypothetical protein ACFB6R_07695 [Alphaproteobacteria bacterium]
MTRQHHIAGGSRTAARAMRSKRHVLWPLAALGLALMVALPALANLSFDTVRFPIIELEARKQNTERGLNEVVATFETEAEDILANVVGEEIKSALPVIKRAYKRAKEEVTRTINASDAVLEDQRNRKIEDAFRTAELEESIQEFRRRLEDGVGRRAVLLYAEQLAALFQVIDDRYTEGIPPEFQRYVRENLAQSVSDDARARLGDTGVTNGDSDVPVPVAPIAIGAIAILVRRLVINNLGRAIVRQLGATLIGRAMSGVGKLFGPVGLLIDLAIAIGALVFAWEDASNETRDAIRQKIEENYQTEVRGQLLDEARIRAIAADLAGPLVGELKRARTVLVEGLGRTYDCVVVQGSSEGAADYVASLRMPDQTEEQFQTLVADRLEQLCRVFGLDFQDISFDDKAALIEAVGIIQAERLVQAHGRRFIDLFDAEPEAVTRLARLSGDDPVVLSHIMDAENVRAELDFFIGLLTRLDGLTPRQLQAAVLVRDALPDVAPMDYGRIGLRTIAENLDALRAARAIDAAIGRQILADVLDQDMSPRSLKALTEVREPAHLEFFYALWRDAGARRFDEVTGLLAADDRRRFLRDMGERTAARMLRSEIALDVVLIYRDPSRGGRRGAIAYFNLYEANRGPLDPESERIVEWLVTRAEVPADRITRDLVLDLRAIGLRYWPDFIAKPLATALAFTGLNTLIIGGLTLIALIVLRPILWLILPRRRTERVVIQRGTRRAGKGTDDDEDA